MADRWRFPLGNPGDLSLVSSHHSMFCDVLTTEDCSGSDGDEDVEEINMPSYFTEAIKKPNDFAVWTRLVSIAEEAKNLAAVVKVYDAFLMQFPFSHNYWKKYAEIVQQLGSAEEVEKIYNRAVKANPVNVILWINYILHVNSSLDMALPSSLEKIDGVFKDAVKTAGLDFHSDELWILYIEWEINLGNLKNATALFDRVFSIPTKEYQKHFNRFKQFVSKYSPVRILDTDELKWIDSKIRIENENDQVATEDSGSEDDIEPLSEPDMQRFREHILKAREQLYLLNEAEVMKRSAFEKEIQCLYFSATPLKMKYLETWRKYLGFEMSQGQHERIMILFERCLMTCALYEEFWLAYAHYMEGHSVEAARSIFERACKIHFPPKVTLHVQWALFEEKHGHLDLARSILCNLESRRPGLAMVRMKRVSLEQRNGNLQEAERLLREAVQMNSGTELASFYAVKLARFLLRLQKDHEKARTVLTEALQKQPDNIRLHTCLLETEMLRESADDLDLCVEQALKSSIDNIAKKYFSTRRLEYHEDFGSSITSLLGAYDKHQTLFKEQDDTVRETDKPKGESETSASKPPLKYSTNSVILGSSPSPITSVISTVQPESAISIATVPRPNKRRTLLYEPPPQPYFLSPRSYFPRPRPYIRMPPFMGVPPRPTPHMYNPVPWFQDTIGPYNWPRWNYTPF